MSSNVSENTKTFGNPKRIGAPAPREENWDVVILGAGLAGLSLARHLSLRSSDLRVLILERRDQLPPERQKVGESSVQVAGHYFSRVLQLEHHLLHEHFMKYNLRFYFRSTRKNDPPRSAAAGGAEEGFEDYSASYIRPFSNVPSYQLDRNAFESELLRLAWVNPRHEVALGVEGLEVEIEDDPDAPHTVRFTADGAQRAARCRWLVDATGRRRFVAKQRELRRSSSIRHGAFFWWVEGTVDPEQLTGLPADEWRKHPHRRHLGHLPAWLATNHFCDEGLWFWVIPLRGKTSLGLVFDHEVVSFSDVSHPEKATRWVCERFPLFARTLPDRKVLDWSGLKSYAHDSSQAIHASRWALTGESGRFTDPLYSPGSDLIAIHNTLIVDAILTEDSAELKSKCQLYESMTKAVYQAYVPSYSTSYDCLGDQECFSLKYAWELEIYFALYVFPFLNDLFTDRRFALAFLRQFSRLGPWNRGLQQMLSGFYRWKKAERLPVDGPRFLDFNEIGNLSRAEKTFYEVGVGVGEAKRILGEQMVHLEEMARFLATHIMAVVLDEPAVYTNRGLVESLDLDDLSFDPDDFRRRWAEHGADSRTWEWTFCHRAIERFRTEARPTLREVAS